IQVELRNPEHDLTRAIRGVLNSYQAAGNLFDTVREELTLTAYVSPDELLPEQLREFRAIVQQVADQMSGTANGRFSVNFVDPEAGDGSVATQLTSDYGLRAMTTSLFGGDRFWFYLL